MGNLDSDFLPVLDASAFQCSDGALDFILGCDPCTQRPIVKDLTQLPNLLIAGATGTGKSTLAHGILLSLIYKNPPSKLQLLLCDSKIIEFSVYRKIPHLLIPIITQEERITGSLQWAYTEMLRRISLFTECGVRSLDAYNDRCWESFSQELPRIVIVIDDTASVIENKEAFKALDALLQNSRAVGFHFILITQTPGDRRMSELIKAFLPVRAVFNTFSNSEERLLLDVSKNALLSDVGEFIFYTAPSRTHERLKSYKISDNAISVVSDSIIEHFGAFSQTAPDALITAKSHADDDDLEGDELFPAAVDAVLETGQASVSMIQRRLKLGYARSANILDEMEEKGIVGPFQGSKPRSILITQEQWNARKFGSSNEEEKEIVNDNALDREEDEEIVNDNAPDEEEDPVYRSRLHRMFSRIADFYDLIKAD